VWISSKKEAVRAEIGGKGFVFCCRWPSRGYNGGEFDGTKAMEWLRAYLKGKYLSREALN
jgi:hypothetical protein